MHILLMGSLSWGLMLGSGQKFWATQAARQAGTAHDMRLQSNTPLFCIRLLRGKAKCVCCAEVRRVAAIVASGKFCSLDRASARSSWPDTWSKSIGR